MVRRRLSVLIILKAIRTMRIAFNPFMAIGKSWVGLLPTKDVAIDNFGRHATTAYRNNRFYQR